MKKGKEFGFVWLMIVMTFYIIGSGAIFIKVSVGMDERLNNHVEKREVWKKEEIKTAERMKQHTKMERKEKEAIYNFYDIQGEVADIIKKRENDTYAVTVGDSRKVVVKVIGDQVEEIVGSELEK